VTCGLTGRWCWAWPAAGRGGRAGGGGPVGALDVLVVRKVGMPGQPELGLGAVTETGLVVWDESGLRRGPAAGRTVRRRRGRAGGVRAPRVGVPGRSSDDAGARRTVVLVDDGIATGVTAGPRSGTWWPPRRRVVVAAPVVAAATVPGWPPRAARWWRC
jgi:putative phosphoribosyl transferase